MKRVDRYSGILLTAAVTGAAALLAGAALALYIDGLASDEPAFTAEKLSGCFSAIKWPLYCILGASAALCAIRLCLPACKSTPRSAQTDYVLPHLNARRNNLIRLFLLGLAIALIFWGTQNGGMKDVRNKAKAICTECIGLG